MTAVAGRRGSTDLARRLDPQPDRPRARGSALGNHRRLPDVQPRLALEPGACRTVAAHDQLQSDGLIEAWQGAGTFVARLPMSAPQAAVPTWPDRAPPPRRAFALGHTDADPALLRDLSRATGKVIAKATPEQLDYGDPRGSSALRREVAAFLASSRGIRCDPGCVLIVAGTQSGLRLCLETLLEPRDAVWMENPGYYVARSTLTSLGLRVAPVAVDPEGLVVRELRHADDGKAAYVTPSHQFPTGVTMSMRRRVALLEGATQSNAWIFEDDYDSEFRSAGPPLTALAGLGSDRVIYSGTFTKTLFPSHRLAYLVLPPAIVERVMMARASHDRFPPRFMQDAVAELIAKGQLARHVRRVRRQYREARDAVAKVLAASAGAALELVVPTQGLHKVAYLPDGYPVAAGSTGRTMCPGR